MALNDFLVEVKKLSFGKTFKPHKYVLLLITLELIQEGYFKENKIFFESVLKNRFKSYISIYGNKDDRNRPHTPFFHLKSSGFWFLKAKAGKEGSLSYLTTVGSSKDITDNIDYAYLSESVYNLFSSSSESEVIKKEIKIILDNYGNKKDGAESDKVLDSTVDYKVKSLFLHEEKAIKKIENQIHTIGRLVNNIVLYDKQSNNYFEIDILLATSFGVFVIELKHWTGHIRISPYNWVVNNISYRSDPHRVNNFKAKIVKGIYQHRFKTFPDIWVESIVVLTNPDGVVEGADSPKIAAEKNKMRNPTFATIDDLITYFKRRRDVYDKQRLDDKHIDAVINYFSTLNQPKQAIKYSVPGYETLEYISQKPECVELVARPIHGGKGLYRFRIFRSLPDKPQKEKERFIKKAHNTIQSISQIGDHPHIHKVWMMENEVGDIIEGSEWSKTGTLRDLIFENKRKFTVDYALEICCGIAEALKEAHGNYVIHRAVKPENILMLNDVPKLINFDLAYQLEDNRLTVIEDIHSLKDDGYIAPEILLGQDIDEGTDFFSLGVIAFELLTGEKPFSSTRTYEAQKGKLDEQNLFKLKKEGISSELVGVIERMLVTDRSSRIKDTSKILSVFKAEEKDESKRRLLPPSVVNRKLKPGETYDVYEIIDLIGEGRESQVYKAKTIRETLVALKLFNREVPREKIISEAEITSAINSSYVVRCENKIGHWENDRYFIVLEYIPGISLRSLIEIGEIPKLKTFKTVALALMEAVRAFHSHKDSEGNIKPLLHGDIKPDNIIITNDERGILIDCGISGEPRIDAFGGTMGYVPPDCLSGTDMSFSENGDLFALGVTLWEWLFGSKPYEKPYLDDKAVIPELPNGHIPKHIKKWLVKAVSTEVNKRFLKIDDMQQAFTEVEEESIPTKLVNTVKIGSDEEIVSVRLEKEETLDVVLDNPFVSYLNSLSNVSAGNENATAEAQITSDYFSCIEVTNPITDFVYEKLTTKQCNIILTGNAGDGKTTIALDIFTKVSGERRPLRPIEKLIDQKLIIIKDMSELDEKDRVSILNEAIGSDENYLIISNTGTLMESFSILRDQGLGRSDSELLNVLEADKPCLFFDDNFLVLNIGRLDSIKTACAVFKRMLEKDNWQICNECSMLKYCPISQNVTLLQDRLALVHERIVLLYRKLFEYSVRLTMRQMIGHLAYAVTAGLECENIKNMSQTDLEHNIGRYLFFNRFFGDNGINVSPEALQLFPVQQILKAEFGIVPDPDFERKAWMKGSSKFNILGDFKLPQNMLNKLFTDDGTIARRQLRRLAYFFGFMNNAGGIRFISTYLRSPMLLEYIDLLSDSKKIMPAKESILKVKILQVLQEYFIGVKLPEDRRQTDDLYITVKQGINGSGTQMVLADFRDSDFKLIKKPHYTVGDIQKRKLCLKLNKGPELLELDLPFFDYVAQRYEGEMAEELSSYYADRLERFKVELIKNYHANTGEEKQYLRLMMIGTDRKFKFIKLAIAENRVEVL